MSTVALAIMAALGFASMAIFARVGMQGVKPIPSTLISLVMSFFPVLLLALVFAWPDIRALPAAGYGWLLGLGALNFLGGRVLHYFAINIVGASRSSVILGTGLVFSAMFAILLAGERPHPLLLAATAGVVIGLVIATGESIRLGWSRDRMSLLGYLSALLAAASYGGVVVAGKGLTLAYGSPLMITAFSLFFGILLLAPLGGRQAIGYLRSSELNPKFMGYAALSGLAAAVASICLFYAVQRGDVTLVAPVSAVSPILTLLLAKIFISRLEPITRQVLVGTGVTVAGVVLAISGNTFLW